MPSWMELLHHKDAARSVIGDLLERREARAAQERMAAIDTVAGSNSTKAELAAKGLLRRALLNDTMCGGSTRTDLAQGGAVEVPKLLYALRNLASVFTRRTVQKGVVSKKCAGGCANCNGSGACRCEKIALRSVGAPFQIG